MALTVAGRREIFTPLPYIPGRPLVLLVALTDRSARQRVLGQAITEDLESGFLLLVVLTAIGAKICFQQGPKNMDEVKQRYLARLPDLPLWVETRDLLLWEGSAVLENPTRSGCVVWSAEGDLGSVVGEPDPTALAQAAEDVSELLAFADNVGRVRSLLPNFSAEGASIFSAPDHLPHAPPHRCRKISQGELAAHNHLPTELAAELVKVAADGVPVVAAFDGTRPVSFAYVASESESLWDVSIDTIESYRRKGYATAAVLHLMRAMREKGKSAVWGALQSNRASANLALSLGFVESDRLWVLARNVA